MIVSALLTSVGINFGLCILFFTLYSVLRKQPANYDVYVPHLLANGKSEEGNRFNLERLLPTPGWVRTAWKPSEDELLASSGLDAVVFMRIIIFSLRVCCLAGIIGVFILLPVNCTGDQLQNIDFANLTNNSLDIFSISNVNNGSKRLWIHFSAVYIVTIFVCYLLYYNDTKKLYKRIINIQTESTRPEFERDGCCGLFRRKVNLVAHQEKKEDLEENLRLEQSEVSLAVEEVRAAFVSFKSRYGAAIAFHIQQSINPTQWITEQAPEPRDVYWPFFSSTFMGSWISMLVAVFACIVLTVLFLIPVIFVQGLANLDQLEVWFPFLKSILSITFVSQVITGYLPSLILLLFLNIVPPIMKLISSIQGHISDSDIEKSACNKVLWFTVWNIFFGNVLSGSVLNQLSIWLDPKSIPATLAVTVPSQASFFISYVVTSGWTSVSTELFRMIPLIFSLISKPCIKSSDDDFEIPSFPYHKDIPRFLFFGLLGIIYFFLAPLILPFLLVYFCLGYIIYRNQFINVYTPKYETAGKFWPIVHNSMIFSLVLMHAIALGIFTLKKLPLASASIVPLPILTLLFNAYCRRRFLPIFIAYSMKSLIHKDREDCNDVTMAEFFDKLATAYQDPALSPIQNTSNLDSPRSPLLSSAEVSG